jgi:hypothetical protein
MIQEQVKWHTELFEECTFQHLIDLMNFSKLNLFAHYPSTHYLLICMFFYHFLKK